MVSVGLPVLVYVYICKYTVLPACYKYTYAHIQYYMQVRLLVLVHIYQVIVLKEGSASCTATCTYLPVYSTTCRYWQLDVSVHWFIHVPEMSFVPAPVPKPIHEPLTVIVPVVQTVSVTVSVSLYIPEPKSITRYLPIFVSLSLQVILHVPEFITCTCRTVVLR